ncbi:hypothetical protein ACFL2T_02520, partial [Elusimicrobiota bacterium]
MSLRDLLRAFSDVLRRSWIVGLILSVVILSGWVRWMDDPIERLSPERAPAGEALIHGLPRADVSWGMPVPAVLQAYWFHRARPAAKRNLPLVMRAVCLLLLFALGRLLHSNACGLLAVLVAARWHLVWFVGPEEELPFLLMILLEGDELPLYRPVHVDPGQEHGADDAVMMGALGYVPTLDAPGLRSVAG